MGEKMIGSLVAAAVAVYAFVRGHCLLFSMFLIVIGELVDMIRSGQLVSLLGFCVALVGMMTSLYQTWKSGDRNALLRTIADMRTWQERQAQASRERDEAIATAERERALLRLHVAQLSKEYLTEHGMLASHGKVFQLRRFTKPPHETSVLVVEDHEATRYAMERLLGYYDFSVRLADSVPAAKDMLRSAREAGRPYDFVLLDLTFPGPEQGMDLLCAIEDGPSGTRAIVISGTVDPEALAAAERCGAVAVLTKPVDKTKLFSLMGLQEEPEEVSA